MSKQTKHANYMRKYWAANPSKYQEHLRKNRQRRKEQRAELLRLREASKVSALST